MKKELTLLEGSKVLRRVSALRRANPNVDPSFIVDAVRELLECRYMLRSVSAWAYSMFPSKIGETSILDTEAIRLNNPAGKEDEQERNLRGQSI